MCVVRTSGRSQTFSCNISLDFACNSKSDGIYYIDTCNATPLILYVLIAISTSTKKLHIMIRARYHS